jgi:alpha-D-glucose phosphate-specific phosphoglucomutase
MDNPDAQAVSFGTDGWRATLSEFTSPRLRMVGQATATTLDETGTAGPVAIGYDARETSREFAEELARVLAANGRDVTITDRDCPTPVLAWTVSSGSFAGGLVVTASHNPPEYNGVKFVPADGAPALPGVTDRIEDNLGPPSPGAEADYGSVEEVALIDPYLDHLSTFVDGSLAGLTVAYDAIHGSGRGVTDTVLERAGADVVRYRCSRDPEFGGVNPEPSPETAGAVSDAVESGEADIGFVNDGDADRVGIVTPEHGYLDPNVVLAVLYDLLLEGDGGDAVRTVSTSSLVDRLARSNGHSIHETPVGFKWVADAMGEHDALVGGEESGGYGVTSHLRNKDGILVALLFAGAERDRSLDERITAILEEHGPIHQDRQSVDCPDDRKTAVMDAIGRERPADIAGTPVTNVSTVDGVKFVLADDTWVLVRPSGTEPKLRIYAEGRSEQRVTDLLEAGRAIVRPHVDG